MAIEEAEGPEDIPKEESQGSSLWDEFSDPDFFCEAEIPTLTTPMKAAEVNVASGSATTADAQDASNSISLTQENLFAEFDEPEYIPTQMANDDNDESGVLGKRKAEETEFSSTSTVVEPAVKKPKIVETTPKPRPKVIQQTRNTRPQKPVQAPPKKVQVAPKPVKFAPRPCDIKPLKLAYDPALVTEFSRLNLSVGVQFELARLISAGFSSVDELRGKREVLRELAEGKTASAPALERLVSEKCKQTWNCADPEVWKELDHEVEALKEDPYAGMGRDPAEKWYGGRVNFRAEYKDKKLVLKPPKLDSSSALKRRFGSWNFLRVDTKDRSEEAVAFFLRPVIIWGMVFRALCAKQGKTSCHVILVCVNETFSNNECRTPLNSRGVGYNFLEFVKFLNDPEANKCQFVGKWGSRIPLYISSSTPGPVLRQCDIHEQDDLYSDVSSADDGSANMTDGCGISNWALHSEFRQRSQAQPTAIQFRLRGGKGMTLCVQASEWPGKPTDIKDWNNPTAPPTICLRSSQIKIKFPPGLTLDPIHLTMAVNNYSELRCPARLSAEVIINLNSNGVDADYFISLAEKEVDELLEIFTEFDEDDDESMFRLWSEIARRQGIMSLRKTRQMGFRERQKKDEDEDEEDDSYPVDPCSGCPSSLGESAMELLDAGFRPSKSVYLREKIKTIAKVSLDQIKENYKFEVPQSAGGYVVADPFGVLKDDEIQVKSSFAIFETANGFMANEILGPVVMTRNPCKIPTDARKVMATTCPELAAMTDVIVCSVKGKRRLLDYLAGGDYDGDRCSVFWDPKIVSTFKNADEMFLEPPPEMEDLFTKDVTTVADLFEGIESLKPQHQIMEVQRYLLGALESFSMVGGISDQHSHCVYVAGYEHPDTVMTGHIFGRVMDSSKTGQRLKSKELPFKNALSYNAQTPPWDIKKHKKQGAKAAGTKKGKKCVLPNTSNRKSTTRPKELGKFIMDRVVDAVDLKYTAAMKQFDKVLGKDSGEGVDDGSALNRPWMEALGNKAFDDDRLLIQEHVGRVYEYWKDNGHGGNKEANFASSRLFHDFPNPERLCVILPGDRLRIMASRAYRVNSKFAFTVAFRELCQLQAAYSSDGYKTCTRNFYERSKLRSSSAGKS